MILTADLHCDFFFARAEPKSIICKLCAASTNIIAEVDSRTLLELQSTEFFGSRTPPVSMVGPDLNFSVNDLGSDLDLKNQRINIMNFSNNVCEGILKP